MGFNVLGVRIDLVKEDCTKNLAPSKSAQQTNGKKRLNCMNRFKELALFYSNKDWKGKALRKGIKGERAIQVTYHRQQVLGGWMEMGRQITFPLSRQSLTSASFEALDTFSSNIDKSNLHANIWAFSQKI